MAHRIRSNLDEAIVRTAAALGVVPRLEPADAEAIAREFVQRWPGLAEVAGDAHLPLLRAMHTWGVSLADARATLGTAAIGIDPEVYLVATGKKRACLKEGVPGADAEPLSRAYRAMGFVSSVVSRHGLDGGGDTHRDGAEFAIVAVGADAEALAEVLEGQRALANDRSARALERVGDRMGYPPCCVRAFAGESTRGDNLENERQPFRRAPHEPLHPLVHRVARVRLVSHHLCSPSCGASVALAEALLAGVSAVSPAGADWIRDRLARPVLFLDYERRAELRGTWEGDSFAVEAAEPIERGREFPASLADVVRIRLREDHVVLERRAGAPITLHAERPLLTIPGAAIAPALLAAIGPPPPAARPPKPGAPGPTLALPAAFRAGVRAGTYRIESVRRVPGGHDLVLARADHRFTLHLRPHDPDRAFTLRRGDFSIDVEAPESLPEPAREAIGLVVRALPA